MTPLHDGHDYYKKMLELQERLRKSEEDRMRLEERFNHLVQESRSRHDACINKLRQRYIAFLEEQRTRDERNHKLLGSLDRVDGHLALMTAKTERLSVLRKQYESYLLRVYGNGCPSGGTGDSGVASQNDDGSSKIEAARQASPSSQSQVQRTIDVESRAAPRNVPQVGPAGDHRAISMFAIPRHVESSDVLPQLRVQRAAVSRAFSPRDHEDASQRTTHASPTLQPSVNESPQQDLPLRGSSVTSVLTPEVSTLGRRVPSFARSLQFDASSSATSPRSIAPRQGVASPFDQFRTRTPARHSSANLSRMSDGIPVAQYSQSRLPPPPTAQLPPSGVAVQPAVPRANDRRAEGDDDFSPCRQSTPLPGYQDYSLRYSREPPRAEEADTSRPLTGFDLDDIVHRNERILPRDYLARHRSESSGAPSARSPKLTSVLNRRTSGVAEDSKAAKALENELDRYISNIKNLHRDLDVQSLEELDREENTSGDLLNVTLSEDGPDLPLTEERAKGETAPDEVEGVLALADDLLSRTTRAERPPPRVSNASDEIGGAPGIAVVAANENPEGSRVTPSDAPISATRRDVRSTGDDVYSNFAKDGIRGDVATSATKITRSRRDINAVAKLDVNGDGDSGGLEIDERRDVIGKGILTNSEGHDLTFRIGEEVDSPGRTSGMREDATRRYEDIEGDDVRLLRREDSDEEAKKERVRIENLGDSREEIKVDGLGEIEAIEENRKREEFDAKSAKLREEEMREVESIRGDEEARNTREPSENVEKSKTDLGIDKSTIREAPTKRETRYEPQQVAEIDKGVAGSNYEANRVKGLSSDRDDYEKKEECEDLNKTESTDAINEQNIREVETEDERNRLYRQEDVERYDLNVSRGHEERETEEYNETKPSNSTIRESAELQDENRAYKAEVPDEKYNVDQRYEQHPNQQYDRDPNDQYEQDPNRQYEQDPNRRYDQDPNYQYQQDSNYQYEQDPNRQYEEDPNRQFEYDPNVQYTEDLRGQYDHYVDQGYQQNPKENYGRYSNESYTDDPNREYLQDLRQQYEQDPNQQYEGDSHQQFEQDPNQQYERDPNQQYEQDPNQQYEQDPNQKYEQDPNQQYEHNPNQQYERDSNQQYKGDPDQQYKQNPNQQYERDSNQQFERDPDQQHLEDPNQQYEQDLDQQYEQDPNRQYEQVPHQGYEEDINPQYDQNSAQQYDPDLQYQYDSNRQYQDNANQQYQQDPNQVYSEAVAPEYEYDPNRQYESREVPQPYVTEEDARQKQYSKEFLEEESYDPEERPAAERDEQSYPIEQSYENPQDQVHNPEPRYEEKTYAIGEAVAKATELRDVRDGVPEVPLDDPQPENTNARYREVEEPTGDEKKKKDVIKSLLDSDTDSTIERNISNATESDFDFN